DMGGGGGADMGGAGGGGGVDMGGAGGSGGDEPGGSNPGGGEGAAQWGLVENPSAGCSIPDLPSVDSLPANSKLPDPFTKMDGTRITDKSEWLCRREEILQELYAFVWGDKPVPPEGATTGTVSQSSISVSV